MERTKGRGVGRAPAVFSSLPTFLLVSVLLPLLVVGASARKNNRPPCPIVPVEAVQTLPCTCDNSPIFILGSGRSGSTTIQEMLSWLNDTYIAGEFNGGIEKLHDFYQSTLNYRARKGRRYSFKATYFSNTALQLEMRTMVKTLVNPPIHRRRWGFKEVNGISVGFYDFLRALYPCSKFILSLRRDLDAQAKSNFWKDKGKEELDTVHSEILQIWEKGQEQHTKDQFLLYLEDFGVEKFNEMASFLGYQCVYQDVLELNVHDIDALSKRQELQKSRPICKPGIMKCAGVAKNQKDGDMTSIAR